MFWKITWTRYILFGWFNSGIIEMWSWYSFSKEFLIRFFEIKVWSILKAQAHEAVLEKSILDQRPPSVNAHVAMQISEYYQMALVNLMKPGINSIASKRFRVGFITIWKKSYSEMIQKGTVTLSVISMTKP
jgi:hypothetical protein